MRTLAVSLVVFAFAAPVIAQSNPLGTVVGGVTNAANGMLGNSPAGASGGRRGHGHAPAARGIPGLPGVPNPLSGNFSRQVLTATADGYMQVPLESFLAARALHHPPYNWNSSGCRFGEVTGPYRDSFSRACARHDFGYRNYGAGGLALDTTEARRTRIDDRLRDDLNGICRADHGGLQETPCVALAQVLYASARATGASWFFYTNAPPPSLPTPGIPGFHGAQNNSQIPGVPLPSIGGGTSNTVPLPGMGGGGSQLPIPGMGGGGSQLPIPGMGGAPNPAQILGGH